MRSALAFLALLAAACGSSPAGTDGGLTIALDEGRTAAPDAGPDGGAAEPNTVGEPCATTLDCSAGETCFDEFPGGFCSEFCDLGDPMDCPAGTSCVLLDAQVGTALCFPGCDPGAAESTCRGGYGCAEQAPEPFCFFGCEVDGDCGPGEVCDPTGGSFGAGDCAPAGARVGDACTNSGACPSGTFCFRERFSGFPGGLCSSFGCEVGDDDGCPEGGVCIDTGFGPICLAACEDSGDCRSAYRCVEDDGGRRSCQPAFDEDAFGQVCSAGRGGCVGGACLSESASGYPDSYCVALGCDPDAAAPDNGCPLDGACVEADSGTTFCLDGCASAEDCRSGYACGPADPARPDADLACVPGCTGDDDCTNGGFVCNRGTGLCRPPFASADLGEPCQGEDPDCVGGSCLSEPISGWPAGTCTFPGCRLAGEGPAATCPGGSVCVDDRRGDPDLGVCVDGCATGDDCRPGYGCSDEGACVPACAGDDDCGPGRACEAATGLCR